jgi:hypothetical protein
LQALSLAQLQDVLTSFPSKDARKYLLMASKLLFKVPLVGLQAQSDAARQVFPQG